MLKKLHPTGFFLIFAGLAGIAVTVVLPVCKGLLETTSGKSVSMRCFWTARAEILLCGLVLLAGLLIAWIPSAEGRRRLSHMVALLGAAVVLTPLYLIPTCANPEMACNLGAKPAWILIGGATLLAGLWGSRAEKLEPGLSAG
jgi:hypothetical protein